MSESSNSLKADTLMKFLLKSTIHSKSTLQTKLSVNRINLNEILSMIIPKMKKFGLKIVGISGRKIVDLMDAEKVFVTRWYDENLNKKKLTIEYKTKRNNVEEKENKKNKDQIIQNFKFSLPSEYFIIFVIIFLESGTILLEKLNNFLALIKLKKNILNKNFNSNGFFYDESLFNKTKENQKEIKFDENLIYKMKKEGYLFLQKDRENNIVVEFDWRFYAELPNFNPTFALEFFCKK